MRFNIIRITYFIGICVIIIAIHSIFNIYLSKSKPIELDSNVWKSWDITYDEKRYNMALWLFKTNWFENKTREDVLKDLPENRKEEIPEDIILYELKYTDEFMERWNIDYIPIPTAYLKIYFNQENNIIKAQIIEGKKEIKIEDFKITKQWEIK